MTNYDETGKFADVECPKCHSKNKTKGVSACGVTFTNPEGTRSWISESQGHDYRFKHNLPKVIEQRKEAELRSHVGAKPYRDIDDISSGKNFDPSKW